MKPTAMSPGRNGELASTANPAVAVVNGSPTPAGISLSERAFQAAFEQAAVGIAHTSLDGRYLLANRRYCEMLGCTHDEILRGAGAARAHPDDREASFALRDRLVDGSIDRHSHEQRYLCKDGSLIWLNRTISLARDEAGRPLSLVHVLEDISERKRVEKRLLRLTRAQQMSSECRRAISRPGGETQLLQAFCDSVVATGGYCMAWIGFAVDDERQSVCVAAHAGFDGDVPQVVGASWGGKGDPAYQGVVGAVLQSGVHHLVRDFAREATHPSRRALAQRRGYRSALTLPLNGESRCFGAVAIYAREADAFDREEVALLTDLTHDLSVGIAMLRTTAARRDAELATRGTEERLRATFDCAAIGIAHVDLDGRYLEINDAFCALVGYSRAELLARTYMEITHPADLATRGELRDRLLKGATLQPATKEKRYVRKDGSTLWVSISISLVRKSSGEPDYIVTMVQDVSDRKAAEDRFRENFEQAAVGVAHVSLEGEYLLVNRKFCRMLGYVREELAGCRTDVVSYPADRGKGAALRQRMLDGMLDHFTLEKRLVSKDGSVIWARLTESLVRDEAREPLYIIRVVEDISERMRTQRALVQQNRLRALLESLAVAANQASTPEQALRECLAKICRYGKWPIGHVVMLADASVDTSIWHLSDAGRWAAFKRVSEPVVRKTDGTGFVNRVISSRRPFWTSDISELPHFRRGPVARDLGLKSAFAFPVVVGSEVVAYLEFFTNLTVEPDEALLDVTTNIGTQLGHVVQRQRTADALLEREQQFRTIVNQASVGITRIGLDGRYLQVNQHYCDIVGYSRDELLQMSVADVIDPADRPQAELLRERLLRKEIGTIRVERRIIRKDRATIWVHASTSLVRDNDGVPLQYVSAVEDISERRRAEAALHESEEQFNQLAGNIPQMFWITSASQRDVIYLSPVFEQITGRTIESAKRNPRALVAMVHQDDRRRIQMARRSAAAGGYDETFRLVRSDDASIRWVRDRAFPIRDSSGQVYRIAGIVEDITERKQADERMLHLAHYDALTNLPNRVLCLDRLRQVLAQARRNAWSAAVLFVDLDRFKNINETLGHASGDTLLQQASERLARCVRAGDTVGRFGGDEYMLILSNLAGAQDAGLVAQKVTQAFGDPFVLDGNEIYVTASIGIALFPGDSGDMDELLRDADTAMYRAKELGRNNFQFYEASMNARALDKLNLESDLRRALDRGEFRLHCQPKASLASGEITGFEALLRWQHPERGLVSPAEFIPLLEETGLIVAAGEWVMRAASAQIKAWRDVGLKAAPIAVNLSARQFQAPDLGRTISTILNEFGIEPGLMEIEITESSLMQNTEDAVRTLEYLASLGLRVSIDDFGTGYSSLAYLKRFPLDALKIDRTFIRDIGEDSDDTAITLALISMAHNLGLKVIAEGVETQAQLAFLRAHACDEMQGYLFSKPLAAEECTQFLRARSRLPRVARPTDASTSAILLVDDDEDMLRLMQLALKDEDYRVLTAINAAEGMQLLAAHEIKVVVSDQQMPGMNGTQFLERVKTLYPHTVRIMLSGHTEFSTVSDALNKGAIFRFLAKNWTPEQLRAEIREAFSIGAGKAAVTYLRQRRRRTPARS